MTDLVEPEPALPLTPEDVTAALDRVYAEADAAPDPFVMAAGVQMLRQEQSSTDEERVSD